MPLPEDAAAKPFVEKWLQKYDSAIEAEVSAVAVDVFVMGPGLAIDTAAARLRRMLIEYCKTSGYAAAAEHAEIQEAVKKRLGDSDLCTIELLYARSVDLLVFIPSSAGSFAELGYFAGVHRREGRFRVASRSLILVDTNHAAVPSFISDGPVRLMRDEGATVVPLDYDDHDSARAALDQQIERTKRAKVRDRVASG